MMTDDARKIDAGTVVALYARVSTKEQEEKKTIDSQLDQLNKFAESKKFTVYKIYKDEGTTGESLSRAGLDLLREDMFTHKFDAVLITCPDRLSRKPLFQNIVEEEASVSGVPIIYLNAGKVPETPEDELLIGIQGEIARYEREKIKQRTRRGKLYKARQGVLITSKPPYGYYYVKRVDGGPKYVVNDKETKVVHLIYRLFTRNNIGMRGICTELHKRGIRPRRGKEHWSKSTIARILSNEVYIGRAYYNKHVRTPVRDVENLGRKAIYQTPKYLLKLRPKDEWIAIPVPSIIDEKTFKTAQRLLLSRKEHFRKPAKYDYLLSGLIFCGRCQHRMNSTPYRNGPYYRCSQIRKQTGNVKKCNAKSISAQKIDNKVWKGIQKLFSNPELVMKYIDKLRKGQGKEMARIKQQITKLDNRIKKNKEYESRAYELYIKGAYKEDELNRQLSKLKAENDDLQKEKDALEKQLRLTSNIPSDFKPSKRFIELYLKRLRGNLKIADFQQRKAFLQQIIDRVVYADNKAVIIGFIPIVSPKKGRLSSISTGCYDHQQRRFRARALHDVDP